LYRLIVESLLGLRTRAGRLYVKPCMPEDWTTYSLRYRHADTVYHITVVRSSIAGGTAARTLLDGVEVGDGGIPLDNDRREHMVEVRLDW
jgi:cellobiose phosphorylase